jgi:hypothetical protein
VDPQVSSWNKYGLMFDQRAANPGQVVGYSDFDHAGDQDERCSICI